MAEGPMEGEWEVDAGVMFATTNDNGALTKQISSNEGNEKQIQTKVSCLLLQAALTSDC